MTTDHSTNTETTSSESPAEVPHVHGPHCNHGHHHDQTPYVRSTPKVGPNESCPCGSGKKYKKCCRA